jgi:hypothetical protein
MQRDVHEKILQALKVFEQLGAKIQEVDLEGVRDAGLVFAAIVVAEALVFHWDWISKRPQDYGSDLRERLEKSKDQAAVVYLQAQAPGGHPSAQVLGEGGSRGHPYPLLPQTRRRNQDQASEKWFGQFSFICPGNARANHFIPSGYENAHRNAAPGPKL